MDTQLSINRDYDRKHKAFVCKKARQQPRYRKMLQPPVQQPEKMGSEQLPAPSVDPPAFAIIKSDDFPAIRKTIEEADLKLRDSKGYTLLHWAVLNKTYAKEAVTFLVHLTFLLFSFTLVTLKNHINYYD